MRGFSVIAPSTERAEGPAQADLDKCVHCGLCLNACPTYRELGVEMDSPRGRIYQMNAVAAGAPITPSYMAHLDLCLACRGCETACPSGVPYGRLIEAARAEIEAQKRPSLWQRAVRKLVFERLLPSRAALQAAATALYLYQASGLQRLVRATGALKLFGNLADLEALSPHAEVPFFYRNLGKTFPATGERRFRVAFLAGCIANVAFARLNEATLRVLQRNGCEVAIPAAQNCCGALHLHSGLKKQACALARNNIDAVLSDEFDAIITNAAGCGSTLKEYGELLAADDAYRDRAARFAGKMKDVTEFLASIELNPEMGNVDAIATYQDSCHLAHGQKIKDAPRRLLRAIPGLSFREMPMADLCCGSAGIYNVLHTEMSMQILRHKMESIGLTGASLILTANPGCMLQLAAGARLYGTGQRVAHVVEVLDEAYAAFQPARVNQAARF
ncbi:MAG TPA: heterodisulfide reductase-related iron-sulfur binding cluster [Bryobacteraceae bacterium]|jgi:glycolate oxidase iron-sulfur subunit|nr:heterodisulfide reductase-related iron-sulfur binding cluster [Bryobacteraceae bacterium]